MVNGSRYLAIVILAAAAGTASTTPSQCLQQPGQNPRVAATGEVVYKTLAGDTPYALAKRFYGHGYTEYKIRQRNPLALTDKGIYVAGQEIVIPPDENGVPVNVVNVHGKSTAR
jgi:nucleoid-associated protein YgaU